MMRSASSISPHRPVKLSFMADRNSDELLTRPDSYPAAPGFTALGFGRIRSCSTLLAFRWRQDGDEQKGPEAERAAKGRDRFAWSLDCARDRSRGDICTVLF